MKSHIVIIGAGISGLTLGWKLRQQYKDRIDLTILEKSSRPGGWIRSGKHEGFFFEQGPRSCRSKGAGVATLQLIEALGLQKEVISANANAQHRFIYHSKKLHHVPTKFWEFMRSPLMKGLPKALWNELTIPPLSTNDESIADFISRRFNAEIANQLVDPLISGIYAGDISKLSMRSCFPEIYAREQRDGSIVKSFIKHLFSRSDHAKISPFIKEFQRRPIFTLKRGMESLIAALTSTLSEDLHLEHCVSDINPNSKGCEILLDNGKMLHADQLYLALPATVATEILQKSNPKIAALMKINSASSIAVVNMGWKQAVLTQEGFGYLIPSREKEDLLGVVWDSSVFPTQNNSSQETRLTAMLGGAHRPDLLTLSDNDLWQRVHNSLHKHLGITSQPDAIKITRAWQAIPQYEVGHAERIEQIEQELASWSNSRLKLVGSGWYGVSVNDCIRHSLHNIK